jgi:hypothetical protein
MTRRAAADNPAAVAIAVLSLLTLALIGATLVFFSRARRASRVDAKEGLVTRVDTQRYLAENWAVVEAGARESGMSEDEIARVRANVLGA